MYQDQLTIIIPTHNRSKYLKRAVDYFSNYNLTIIICDSSSIKSTLSLPKQFKYFHYPKEEYVSKITKVMKQVQTDYLLFCADDDFFVMKSIKKCVEFLEQNKDYSSCQGQYVTFEKYRTKLVPAYIRSVDLDISESSEIKRMNKLMNAYMHLIYSVHRTKVISNFFEEIYKTLSNYNLIEMGIAMYSLIAGKHKLLPILYCARELNDTSNGKLIEPFYKQVQQNGEEYNKFVTILTEKLKQKGIEVKKEKVKEIFKRYAEKMPLHEHSKLKHIRKFAEKILPSSVYKKVIAYLHEQKMKQKTRHKKGFPHSDKESQKEAKKILFYLKKYSLE